MWNSSALSGTCLMLRNSIWSPLTCTGCSAHCCSCTRASSRAVPDMSHCSTNCLSRCQCHELTPVSASRCNWGARAARRLPGGCLAPSVIHSVVRELALPDVGAPLQVQLWPQHSVPPLPSRSSCAMAMSSFSACVSGDAGLHRYSDLK